MKKSLLLIMAAAALNFTALAQTKNKLTAKERGEGYTLLFNGENTDGWHLYNGKDAGAWRVHNGILQLDTAAQGQGDIITDHEYENFELKLDWKIPIGGNSGIIFPVHEDPAIPYTFFTGMEMQVLDDKNAEDNKQPNHLAGSLYDIVAPAHAAKPAEEWNSIIIRKVGKHIAFWMNGEKVVDIEIGSKEWNDLYLKSKFVKWKAFLTYPKGHIALQDHGAAVAFRYIRIKQL